MSAASEMQRIADSLDAVSAGKVSIADAITAKGVPTPMDATFEQLAVNVGLIEGGGGGLPYTDITMTACANSAATWERIYPTSMRSTSKICFAWKISGDLTSPRMMLAGMCYAATKSLTPFVYNNTSGAKAVRSGYDASYMGDAEEGSVFRRYIFER